MLLNPDTRIQQHALGSLVDFILSGHLKSGQWWSPKIRPMEFSPGGRIPVLATHPWGQTLQTFPSPVSIGPTAYQSAGQGRAERAGGEP